MKRLPFNACDYRCERCLETEQCAVFQKLQERSLLHRLNGVDENDPGVVLEDVRRSFQETEEMIKQKARDFGIDIDEIAGGVSAAEIREERKSTEKDPLYQKAFAFTSQAHRFIKDADSKISGEAGEYLNDIAWHHTVVSAKVYRALGWKTGDTDIAEDAVNSAAVAMKSLTICIMAFDHLASAFPVIFTECTHLSAAARNIKEEVKKRFKPGRS